MAAPLLAAAIPAVAGAASSVFNAASQANLNEKNRQWQEDMYQKQLHHSYNMWDLQNAYNSPTSQMSRLRDAGLNPNLVYGSGGANQGAASVHAPSAPNWSPSAPRIDLASPARESLSSYYDVQIKQAQYDNLKSQNTVLVQDAVQKAAQTASILQGTEVSKFDLDFKSELRHVSADALKASLNNTLAQTAVTLNQDERAAASNAMSLKEAGERILNMRGQRSNTMLDNKLKQLDINLKQQGIQPSDPAALRMLGQVLKDVDPIGMARQGAKRATSALKDGYKWLTDKFK